MYPGDTQTKAYSRCSYIDVIEHHGDEIAKVACVTATTSVDARVPSNPQSAP